MKAWVVAAMVVAALTTAPSGAAQTPDGEQCPPRSGRVIVITAGDIDCVTASDFAVQYDLQGDKNQPSGRSPATAVTR